MILFLRCELLREWKRQYGLEATYANLLKACVETSNAEAARKIFEVLNGKFFSYR